MSVGQETISPAPHLDGGERRSVSMLMTRYFVLLQVPHTASELIRAACIQHLPREALIPNDLDPFTRREQIAADFSDLPMFAVVRNPWDWYVTWYRNAMSAGMPESNVWTSAFDAGRADFKTALTRVCTGEGFKSDVTRETMRRLDVDHYSALHARAVGDDGQPGDVEVARFEQLAQDFARFLSARGVPQADLLAAALGERLAAAERVDYRPHYDSDLRDLVATRARRLLDQYQYEF